MRERERSVPKIAIGLFVLFINYLAYTNMRSPEGAMIYDNQAQANGAMITCIIITIIGLALVIAGLIGKAVPDPHDEFSDHDDKYKY